MCVVYCMPFLCEIIMFIIKHILFAENYLLVSCERLSSTFSIRYTINEELFLGSPPRVYPLGSPTNRISLFQIRYLLKKKTKYCQVIMFLNKKVKKNSCYKRKDCFLKNIVNVVNKTLNPKS